MNQSLLNQFIEQKRLAIDLEARAKEARAILEGIQAQLLEEFTEDGVQSIKTTNGTVYMKKTIRVSSPDMPLLCETFKASGLEDFVKETINNNTLRGWVNEQMRQGTEIPPAIADLLNITEEYSLNVTGKGN